jgi:hypothetical protein
LNICEKKRESNFGLPKKKKKQAPFSPRFVSNTLSKKQKKLFWKLLVQKESCWFVADKKQQQLFLEKVCFGKKKV